MKLCCNCLLRCDLRGLSDRDDDRRSQRNMATCPPTFDLAGLPADTIRTLQKYASNVLKHPSSPKFHRIKMANRVFASQVAQFPSAKEALLAVSTSRSSFLPNFRGGFLSAIKSSGRGGCGSRALAVFFSRGAILVQGRGEQLAANPRRVQHCYFHLPLPSQLRVSVLSFVSKIPCG